MWRATVTMLRKAGVIVYSIYYGGRDAFDQNLTVTDGGQNYLTQVSAKPGQVYLEGLGPGSFSPFLSDIQRKLQKTNMS